MAIDLKLITKLREATGMGISNCKKALEENNGDFEAAEMTLRKQGLDKAAKKADRPTGQGVVAVRVDGLRAAIIELACEQEPTTGNERFVQLVDALLTLALEKNTADAQELLAAKNAAGATAQELVTNLIAVVGENVQLRKATVVAAPAGGLIGQYTHFNKKAGAVVALALQGASAADAELKIAADDCCMHAVAARPIAFTRDAVPADVIAKEREVFLEEAKSKPENMREKIVEGKLSKFYADKVLPEQLFVKDPTGKTTVKQMLEATAKQAGGTASIVAFARFELGL